MTPDRINASLEYLGVLFALYNCVILVQDAGQVQGVSVASTGFFTAWGLWNLFYYPYLGQKASGIAAGGLVLANGAWLVLFALYRGNFL
jgi:hypothetical protein